MPGRGYTGMGTYRYGETQVQGHVGLSVGDTSVRGHIGLDPISFLSTPLHDLPLNTAT